jgi:hypothetical protein
MPHPAPPAPPLAPAPTLDRLTPQLGQFVQQAGVQMFVILARDPQTGNTRVLASNGAMDDLRDLAAEKFGLSDGSDTAWE